MDAAMNLRPIQELIEQAQRWRVEHRATGRHIEAAATDIRIKALKDALTAMEKRNG